MSPTSRVWENYHKIPDTTLAKCLHCGKEYSYKTTITNLKKHLNAKHKNVYNSVKNDPASSENSDNPHFVFVTSEDPRCSLLEPVYTTTVKTTPGCSGSTKQKQRKLKRESPAPNVTTPRKIDESHKKQIDKKLLNMIVKEFLPFSIVEEQGFQDFVKLLNPTYELPHRKKLSKTLIPGQYLKCKKQIKELVKTAKTVCLTIENWTSLDKESFLAVSVHFMIDFDLKNVMLHCEYTSDLNSPEALASILQNITLEWDINEKISYVVSNSPYNLKKASEKNQWPHNDCFLHKFNLIIEKSLNVIDFIIQKVRKIVSYFKRNVGATESLINYQSDYENKSQPLRLIRSDPTRWTSVYFMLERFSLLQSALQAVIPKLRIDLSILSSDMWSTIKQIVMILQPFEEASRVMCATKYLSASLAIIIVDGLKNVVQVIRRKPIFDSANTFLDSLEQGLNEKFPDSDINNNMILGVCTLVDPRFKMHAFFDQTSHTSEQKSDHRGKCADLLKQHVVNLIKNKIRERQQPTFSPIVIFIDPQNTWAESEPITIQTEPEKLSVWGKIDKNIAAVTPSHDDISTKAINELNMFLKEEVIHRSSCPLAWWKQHALVYPNLAEIFHDHAHIVLSSVPCVNFFSETGKVFMEKRSRLSRKHTAELVFINYNEGLCDAKI